MATKNVMDGFYFPGKPLPNHLREEVIRLYNLHENCSTIAKQLRLSRGSVYKLVNHYARFGTVAPFSHGGKNPTLITDDVLQLIEIFKLQKPSSTASEIRQKFITYGIFTVRDAPRVRQIQNVVNKKLGMTYKKLTSIPSEYITPQNLAKVDSYLDRVSRLDSNTLHFFDESSVILTTGNRRYGSAYRGKQAIEIQKYASNANYTINLLHSMTGVDYFNILNEPSNGQHMIDFFLYVLDMHRPDGTRIFLPGDSVVMDNCGFHHGRVTEALLRGILLSRGVQLIFQPPYSPHLNTCELCFSQMKSFLRKNELYALHQTEMAINDAINEISALNSLRYFKHCGYII